MAEKTMGNLPRNHGLDLLRILATVMVVIIHLLVYGGWQENIRLCMPGYGIIWFLGILADCAVNCFALLSGYVSYETKFRYTNILRLHLTVLFHGMTLTLLFGLFVPGSVGLWEILRACFPLITHTYWYFTLYVGVFFLSPLLNWAVRRLNGKWIAAMLAVMFVLFSLLPTATRQNLFWVNKGYSLVWLAALYFTGACLKKYREKLRIKKWVLLTVYLGSSGLTWVLKMLLEVRSVVQTGEMGDFFVLTDYCSPLILLAAVALVLLFSVLPVPEWKLRALSFFVPLSFSVYIIHEHPLVRSFIIRNSMLATLQLKPMLQLLVVLGCAVKIWLLCSGLDWLRVRFFRWLQVEKALLMLERFLAPPPKKI